MFEAQSSWTGPKAQKGSHLVVLQNRMPEGFTGKYWMQEIAIN